VSASSIDTVPNGILQVVRFRDSQVDVSKQDVTFKRTPRSVHHFAYGTLKVPSEVTHDPVAIACSDISLLVLQHIEPGCEETLGRGRERRNFYNELAIDAIVSNKNPLGEGHLSHASGLGESPHDGVAHRCKPLDRILTANDEFNLFR
jgi:hypothetical protein